MDWVSRHNGKWNHEDWLELLRDLEQSQFWPMDPDDIGALIEKIANTRRLNPPARKPSP